MLPILALVTVGRNGVLYYLNTSPPSIARPLLSFDLGLLRERLTTNASQIALFFEDPGRIHLQEFELLTFVGIGAAATMVPFLKRQRWFWAITIAHVGILLACVAFYNWHVHVRIAMWFVPFVYVFSVTALWLPRPRWAKGLAAVWSLLLLGFLVDRSADLFGNEIPTLMRQNRERHAMAVRARTFIERMHPATRFVMIPQSLSELPILDIGRVYYMRLFLDWNRTYADFAAVGKFPDLIFADRVMLDEIRRATTSPWLHDYRPLRSSPGGWSVLVRGRGAPPTG